MTHYKCCVVRLQRFYRARFAKRARAALKVQSHLKRHKVVKTTRRLLEVKRASRKLNEMIILKLITEGFSKF